jgi:outer membrane protein assembly factor BamB
LLGTNLEPSAALAGDWPFYRHDLFGTSDAQEDLSAADATTLTIRWRLPLNYGGIANPIVANGSVYVTGADGAVHAVDAQTGVQRWARSSRIRGPFHCLTSESKGPVGAPAVVGDTVFMPGGDGVVYAYDAATGATRWQTQIANVPDLGEFLWASAFPLFDRVYVGVSSLHDCLLVPGRLVALNQATGEVAGTWWANDDHGPGGGVWTQQAYDARTNRLFLTTGTIAPGHHGEQQPYTDAFVAIDPITMQTLDHFKPVDDTYEQDVDFGASPVLYDTSSGRHLIAAVNKNGFVYALDRDNLAAGLVWQFEISGYYGDPDAGLSTIVSPAYASGRLFVGGTRTIDGYSGTMAALDAETGIPIWSIHPPNRTFILAAPALAGETVIFAATQVLNSSNPSTVYVLSQATGETLFSMNTRGALFSEPTFANGMLYFMDLDTSLWALAPGSGTRTFVDDFDRTGGLGPNWSVASGAFITDGTAALGTAPSSYAFWAGSPTANATVSITLSPPTDNTNIGIMTRATPSNPEVNHYAGFVAADGTLYISRRNNYDYTFLGTGPALSPGAHALTLQAFGANPVTLHLLVDGIDVLTVTDGSGQSLTDAGKAGMLDYNGRSQPLHHFVVQ